ncbi:MAG: 2TM domain-containing protein [Candidatus Kapaibacterium sp.]|jgi:hypothetical protein
MRQQQRFSREDADSILRNLLHNKPIGSHYTLADLENTAIELGITKDELKQAVEAYMFEKEELELRNEVLRSKKRKLYDHIAAFTIVNGGLFFLDYFTSNSGWYIYSLIGWGIGLAFDVYSTFMPKEQEIEKSVQKLRKKRGKSKQPFDFKVLQDGAQISIGKDISVSLSEKGIVWKKGDTTIEI